jgi:hypothetical protein
VGWGERKQIERKFEEMRQNNEQSSSQCAESQKRLRVWEGDNEEK